MIIGIDGNEANVANRVGIGEYAFELLRQFKEFQISNIKFQIYLKNVPLSHMPAENNDWQYRVVKPRKLWTQVGLPLDLYLHSPKPDVFFSPTHYAPRFSPVPTVIAIMDLAYMHFPELFKKKDLYQLRSWTEYSANKATRIFTISEASKNDIIDEYHVRPDNIVVTYPGIKNDTSTMKQVTTHGVLKEKYGITSSYILFVGTLQPRKNITRLIEAYAKLRSEIKDAPELIIVGKKGWQYEAILEAPEKYGITSYVRFLDFVPDEDLGALYQQAACFILPSLYEGFGLPILEAMKNNCPVITSNVSSMPEVGGDAAVYVDPNNVIDITTQLKRVLEDTTLRKEMIEKGQQQVKKFSWEKTAKETLQVLEHIASKNV